MTVEDGQRPEQGQAAGVEAPRHRAPRDQLGGLVSHD
jgi:hypothetical protein